MTVHVHWMNLTKNQIIQNFQNLEIFERKGYNTKDLFFKPFDKKIMFKEFKMSNFRCKSLVKEINMPKNIFDYALKFILENFVIFCISSIKLKYSYTIMYDCEKPPLTYELSYIGLFNFFNLSLFHVNVICKK